MKNRWIVLVLCTFFFVVVISLALADSYGQDRLGPPSIDIATGNGLVAAGTGMVSQPGTINFSIPDGATIKQVLLYWEGRNEDPPNPSDDDTIVVEGTEVTGKLIGGPTLFCSKCFSSSFRADITDLELVAPGNNELEIKGLDFTFIDNGAGVLVLFEDSAQDADFELFDGVDIAFWKWEEPRDSTVPQTFTFAASTSERQAQLSLFVASILPFDAEEGLIRPNSIEVKTGGITKTYSDLLANSDGDEWDTLNLDITIPAGAESLTVQIFSRDDKPQDPDPLRDQPASLAWIAAGLMVPSDVIPVLEVSKNCTPNDVFLGDGIEYEFTVSNTGDADLIDVVVEDSHLGRVAEIDSLPAKESRTINETWIADKSGVITNTAQATGKIASSLEPIESNLASAECNVYELEVEKDAQTSYVRQYKWKINKRVNETKKINFTLLPTQVVSPTYDVAIKPDYPPFVDSDWIVSGTISITNPAPIETELVANLNSVIDVISFLDIFHQYLPVISKSGDSQDTDVGQNQPLVTIPPGISVPVVCPSLTIQPGQTLVCTYGSVDLETGLPRTNTAVAELKNRVGGEFNGTTLFGGTAQIDFASGEVELIDEEVTVTDSMLDLSETVNIENAPKYFIFPEESMPSFTVEECMNVDQDQDPETDSNRKQVVNTATFTTNDTGTEGSSSAEVNLYCIISASTGFEDLPMTGINDWDYNDAFFEVSFDPEFSDSNDLEKITFQFIQTVNWSVNTHEFHIQPDVFQCNGNYTLTRSDETHGDEKEEGTYTNGQDLKIFDDTALNRPPGSCAFSPSPAPKPNTATLVIEFDVPSPGACPLDLGKYDPIGTFNGEGLFYVPSLVVKNRCDEPENWPANWYTIKPTIPPDPRIVGVPDTWPWPKENQCIWKVYPDITPANPNEGPPYFEEGITEFWWENYVGPNNDFCPGYPLTIYGTGQ